MATKTAPPTEAETPAPAPQGNRFFTWMRGLGITRQPGWIGGVAAGIATRLGIDPLIVRGIIVVVAVLGGPAILLYAAAWLLLPDAKNKIHLEELIHGRLESPIAGIGAMVLLSLLPIAQGFWYTGALYWGQPSWGESIGRAVWALVVLAAIVAFIVWIARRSSDSSEPLITPATTDDRPDTIPQPVSVAPTASAPKAPAAGAPEEEVAAWRAQQEAWKAEREAFRASQAAAARETARLRAQESRERSIAAAERYKEKHRAWLAANPRAGAAYSAIALGTAALAGGIAAIASPLREQPVTGGLAVAAIVLGLAIVVAGIVRRRSGFLAFVSVLVLGATLLSAVIPPDRTLVLTSWGISNIAPGRYFQPVGDLYISLDPSFGGGTIDIVQGAGNINVRLLEGMTARIEITSQRGEVWLSDDSTRAYSPITGQEQQDGAWHSDQVYGAGTTPTVTLRITQGPGSIIIQDSTQTLTETDPKS
ncbi:MAG: hypothetical protein JWR04_474 [Rhodoglobus sp.]|nr:hypothetical protein [Rhodoglobus sp.]